MDFETFLAILAMCGFHEKFSSRITPKNADSLTWSIVHWLISSLMLIIGSDDYLFVVKFR